MSSSISNIFHAARWFVLRDLFHGARRFVLCVLYLFVDR